MLGDGVVAAVGGSVGAGVELDGVAPFVLDAPDGWNLYKDSWL